MSVSMTQRYDYIMSDNTISQIPFPPYEGVTTINLELRVFSWDGAEDLDRRHKELFKRITEASSDIWDEVCKEGIYRCDPE